jgi:hypothetical protein
MLPVPRPRPLVRVGKGADGTWDEKNCRFEGREGNLGAFMLTLNRRKKVVQESHSLAKTTSRRPSKSQTSIPQAMGKSSHAGSC